MNERKDDMDDMNDLREILAKAPPPAPDAGTRARAIDAAMGAFDASEEISPAAQGSAAGARPTSGQSGPTAMWRRLMNLTLTSTRGMMLGGASAAVLALALITTTEQMPVPEIAPERQIDAGAGYRTGADGRTEQPKNEVPPAVRFQSGPVQRDNRAEPEFNADRLSEISNAPAEPAAPLGARQQSGAAVQSEEAARMRKAAPAQTQGVAVGDIAQSQARTLPIAPPAPDLSQPVYQDQGRDQFAEIETNPVKRTAEDPVSTFSIDVDTASYSFVRAALMNGVLPQKDAVRVEEMINYFPYDYAPPESRETPFATHVSVMPTPWDAGTRLLRIGIQGYELAAAEKPRSNLVFLIDTSGSMNHPDKLPLLINSFRLLVENLEPEDTVSIVVYAGSAGTVLEPTKVAEKSKILASLERLRAGGSTAGAEGIRQAYRLAAESFDKEGINRVILATDGDFNVGITSTDELQDFVERKREEGIFLSVLGFGRGNLNDRLMQALAQNGNGNAAYIDTLSEARKTLVEEASSTLFPIAKDVKIQIEFNPATVSEYRLIGYETRLLAREDFNNDKVDAGEIGSGHAVTALYEITPAGSASEQVDALRYQREAAPETTITPLDIDGEYAFLKIRYKEPDQDTSRLITRPVTPADDGEGDADARFAASVAAFGQLLRGGRHMDGFGYADVIALANGAKGDDPFGYRAEFVNLVRLAESAAALEPQRR